MADEFDGELPTSDYAVIDAEEAKQLEIDRRIQEKIESKFKEGMWSPGTQVMVLIPGSYRNFVFVGIAGPCIGAYTYVIQQAHMVLNSGNGVDWFALARGENRGAAQFSAAPDKDGLIRVGPQFGVVVEWVGKLPVNGVIPE